MKSEIFYLNPDNPTVTLTSYIAYDPPELNIAKRPAMLIFPGGAYSYCSDREAEPVAKAYSAKGFNTFILRYSLNEKAKYPQPLIEASLAVKHIRDNAEEYNIDVDRVFVIGFSAGGHLAGCLATMWHKQYLYDAVNMDFGVNKPNGAILSYAVLSPESGPYLLYNRLFVREGELSAEELKMYSAVDNVSEQTPPIFMWHTANDSVVPVQNSLNMAAKLTEYGLPFELHVYPEGAHGLSLATEETSAGKPDLINPAAAEWFDASVKWMNGINK